ncbi:MAG: lytic transglycosylase domain-containing protein [Desulfosalsimonadaceae bacterium]
MDKLKYAILACLILAGFMAVGAKADIYSYVDENGVLHFSNTPTTARYQYHSPEAGADISATPDTGRFDPYIREAANRYGLNFALVKAVVCTESRFKPAAVSRAGAIGLMQIMPANLNELQLSDPYNPRANIMAGAGYLKSLLERFNNDLRLSLAAYNAGPGVVERYQGVPPYRETQNYIKRVMKHYRRFRRMEN